MFLLPPDAIHVDRAMLTEIDNCIKSIYRLIIFDEEHNSSDLLKRYLEAVEHLRVVLNIKNAQQEAQSIEEARVYLDHLKDGMKLIVGEIAQQRSLDNPVDLFRLFRMIAPEAAERHPNHFRQTVVQFGPCLGAEPSEIQGLVTQLFDVLPEIRHPALRALYVHHELVRIHPFVDGNGRVSRMAKNWLLMYELYPPMFISGQGDRRRYISSMQASFLALQAKPFEVGEATRHFFEEELRRIRASAGFILDRMLRYPDMLFGGDDEQEFEPKLAE